MQTITQVVDGHLLNQVISLPTTLLNSKVKVVVIPIAEKKTPKLTRAKLRESLKGSKIEALTGIAKTDENIDLKEMQEERRMLKYGHPV